MAIIGMVFARGGSKTIPNKNLKYIRNNRLIDIALKDLKNSEICDLICISSDSDEILDASKLINAQKIKRPLELSKDNSSEILAWKHAVEYLNLKEEDIILVAPTTSPLRSILTLKKIIQTLKGDNETDGVLAIRETSMHPNFNIIRKINDEVKLWEDKSKQRLINRQEGNDCFDVTTVGFCYRVSSIRKMKNIFDGKIRGIEVSIIEGLDIDTPLDLEFVRYLSKDGLSFLSKYDKDYL